VLQVRKGNRTQSFYTLPEYEAWKESLANTRDANGWDIKYYKGEMEDLKFSALCLAWEALACMFCGWLRALLAPKQHGVNRTCCRAMATVNSHNKPTVACCCLPPGLGTSTAKEAKEYFANMDQHKKNFVWEGEWPAAASRDHQPCQRLCRAAAARCPIIIRLACDPHDNVTVFCLSCLPKYTFGRTQRCMLCCAAVAVSTCRRGGRPEH
jgi:hypothetical protein